MPYKSKEAKLAYSKTYREANRLILREKNRQYRKDNVEKERAGWAKRAARCQKHRLEYAKKYRELNKQKLSESDRKWRLENPGLKNAKEARRRAAKLKATPKWLTKEHHEEMKQIYIEAQELSWLSDGGLEVDHIIPLQGKEVKGLHVPWNLQIIPADTNRRKSNKVL